MSLERYPCPVSLGIAGAHRGRFRSALSYARFTAPAEAGVTTIRGNCRQMPSVVILTARPGSIPGAG
jgi:hypothetical protein